VEHDFAVAGTFGHRPMSFVRSRDQNRAGVVVALRVSAIVVGVMLNAAGRSPEACANIAFGRFEPFATPLGNGRYLRIPLNKPSSISLIGRLGVFRRRVGRELTRKLWRVPDPRL
jgi:hypothetical protein